MTELQIRLGDDQLVALADLVAERLRDPAPTAEDGWLTARDAATHLSLSLDALYKRTRQGVFPAVRETDGGKMFFRKVDLDAWRLSHSRG